MKTTHLLIVLAFLALNAYLIGAILGFLNSGKITLSMSADALTEVAVATDILILGLIGWEDFGKERFLCQKSEFNLN
jgi:uncharacterized membrane protein